MQVRGPRVLAALGWARRWPRAGAAYQGMFRNPLVSPDILGVSTGAALGAVLGIFFSRGPGDPAACLRRRPRRGGLVYWIGSRLRGHDPLLALVLTGVVSARCSAR